MKVQRSHETSRFGDPVKEWAEHCHPCSNCGFLRSESIQVAYPDLPALPHHLLTTNDPPSDAEAIELRNIVDGLHSRISNLDESMARLSAILEQLRTTRKDAVEHLHRCSSIRYLPDDALGEIFPQAVPDTQRHRTIVEKSPWILGRVYSRWRAVSLSYSALWSNIGSDLPAGIRTAQLERSKACGLTIHLNHHETEAIGPLVDCSIRWETVVLQLGIDMLPMLDRVRGNVPMLRALIYGGSTGAVSCTAFQTAPNLPSVTITGGDSLDLPWPQLTRLRREGLSAYHYPREVPPHQLDGLSHLLSSRNLVGLSLTGPIRPSGLPAPSMIELPRLHVLYIDDGKFLDFFVLPALEELYESQMTTHISSLIDRSSCCLWKITGGGYFPIQDCGSILARTPRLLKLRLLPSSSVKLLIAHLTIPSNVDNVFRPPCPELHSVSLCNINTTHECPLVVNMIQSRMDRTMCSTLLLAMLNLEHARPNGHESAALERLRALGTIANVECLFASRAKHRVDSWKQAFP